MTNMPFQARVIATMGRLNMTSKQCAGYLGVPIRTFEKWARGERSPSAVADKLIDVLYDVETMCPALHAMYMKDKAD